MHKEFFLTNYSRAIRLWHWGSFIMITLILFTVFADKILFNRFETASVIHEGLLKSGIAISREQSFGLAGDLDEKLWKWHIRYGYVLSGLLGFRILIEFFQPRKQQFFSRLRNGIFFLHKKEDRPASIHFLLVRILYLLFYLLLSVMAATGLWLSFHRPPVDPEQFHAIKEVHETGFTLLLLFILIHLAGVIRAERKSQKNIVSAMIHGGKEKDSPLH